MKRFKQILIIIFAVLLTSSVYGQSDDADLNDLQRFQVPAAFSFDEKYSIGSGTEGLLEFHFAAEGCQPLDQDIYGNELVINDNVAETDQQPLLKNLAHAAGTGGRFSLSQPEYHQEYLVKNLSG